MTEPEHLRLVDRLRGIYRIPVDDGAGPLDGSMTFSRTYKPPHPLQPLAADMIDRLVCGEVVSWGEVNKMVLDLQMPADPFGTGKMYVLPIHQEAASEIYHLRLEMEDKK